MSVDLTKKSLSKSASKKLKKGIGLALGGGGVRACVHIGFYEILLKYKVPICCVAGTSMGAVVGAGISLGFEPNRIKESVLAFGESKALNWKNFNFFNESLFKREAIDKVLEEALGGMYFQDTNIPFSCTAVDLESASELIMDEGLIWKAVAASTAYPPLFAPVFYKHSYLVDGGILDNVPALLARKLGAKNLVAVMIENNMLRESIAGKVYLKHIGAPVEKEFGKVAKAKQGASLTLEVLLQSMNVASDPNTHARLKKANPEVYIREFVNYDLMDFTKTEEVIQQGREMGERYIEKILKLL